MSPPNGKSVNSGSVTEAYAQNATRITKQVEMEQKQCGFLVLQGNPPTFYRAQLLVLSRGNGALRRCQNGLAPLMAETGPSPL